MSSGLTPNLAGQVAIVTGGGRGIGRAIALGLAGAGVKVAVADLDTADTVAAIEANGGQAITKTVDVTDQSAVDQMVRDVEQQFGTVDLLMNNAGVGAQSVGLLWEVDPNQWWRTIDVNLRGPFLCARAVLPGMIRRRRGRIINMASGAATGDALGITAYSAAKAGLARLTGCLALETRAYGIGIFAIQPGFVRTKLVTDSMVAANAGSRIVQDDAAAAAAFFEKGGGDSPELAARLVVQLASGKADTLSGRYIDVFDDLDELIRRVDEITRDDLYSLKRPALKPSS